jgi:hypothetical protein
MEMLRVFESTRSAGSTDSVITRNAGAIFRAVPGIFSSARNTGIAVCNHSLRTGKSMRETILIRWRRTLKVLWTAACTERNLCAVPTHLNPFILRSRRRSVDANSISYCGTNLRHPAAPAQVAHDKTAAVERLIASCAFNLSAPTFPGVFYPCRTPKRH